MKNKIIIFFFGIIAIFLYYTILSITKYSMLLGFSTLSFQDILSEMTFLRIFLSFILAFITSGFFSIFTKNLRLARQQQEMIQTMSSNNEKIVSRFEDFVNLLPEGLYETDKERKVTFISDNLSNLLGYEKDELIGWDITKLLSPSSLKKALEEYEKRINGINSNGSNSYDFIAKDGKIVSVVLHAIPRREITGKIIGTRGVVLDVTAINKLRQDYEKSYNIMKLLIDTIKVPVFLQNMKGEITHFNKALIDFCNKKDEEDIYNKTVFQIFSRDIASVFYKKTSDFMRVSDTKKNFHINLNDKEIMVSQSKYINQENTYESGIVNVIQDKTEIESMQDELLLSEETWHVLSEQSILGVAITRDKTVHYMNDKLPLILGYQKNEINFSPEFFRKIICEKDIDKFTNMVSIAHQEKAINGHLRIITKSGAFKHVEVEIKKIKCNSGESVLYIIVDITPYVNVIMKKCKANINLSCD